MSTINVECIYEDYDLYENISRDQFVEMNQEVFQRFTNFMAEAVQEIKNNKNIDISNLHSVERIGGGTRIPLIE